MDALEITGERIPRRAQGTRDLIRLLAAQGIGLGGIDKYIGDIQARESLMDREVGPGRRDRDVFPMQTVIPDDPRDAMRLDPERLFELQNILLFGAPRGGLRGV